MAVTWHLGSNAKELATATLRKALEDNAEREVLLLLSGGSWIDLLDNVTIPVMKSISISVLDDRYSTDPLVSNYEQLTHTRLFREAQDQSPHTIDTRIRVRETHHHHAGRFQTNLNAWRSVFPDGALIATMGFGADGHTAGILPQGDMTEERFTKLFDNPEIVVAGYETQAGQNPHRARTTVTFPFLRDNVDKAIVYFSGEKKCHLIPKIRSEEGTVREIPARIVREMKDVDIFTDCP